MKTLKSLRLTDAAPTLVDASAASGQAGLYPTAPLSGFQFENPHGLAFGLDGVLYVADPRRHVVYRVLPDGATGEIGPNSRVELGLGRGGGSAAPSVGERYPAATFPINQPVRLSLGEDGVVLVVNDYAVTAYDPVAKEAETLLFDDSRDELTFGLTDYFANPSSFVAVNKWSLFTRLTNQSPVRIDLEPLSSERDPTRTLRPQANGNLELVDTTAGQVSRYDAAGRLVEQRRRTGEPMYTIAYADADSLKVDRITNATGGAWIFSYANDKLASITDPAGGVTNATVDDRGDLTALTFADGERNAFSYDKHKMVSKTSPAGDVNAYTYNADGTAATAVKSSGETHTFSAVLANDGTYASDGTLVRSGRVIDSHGVTHDVVTNVFGDIEKDTYVADGVTYEKKLVYAGSLFQSGIDPPNAMPRRNAMLRAANSTLNGVPLSGPLLFDRLGRPVSQHASPGSAFPGAELRGWRYDDNGWLSAHYESVYGAVPERFERDAAGHVTRVYQDFGGGSLREATFTWRDDGQLATSTVHGVTTTYTYDDAPGHTANLLSTSDTTGRTSLFGYDARGNVTSVSDGTASSAFVFDAANRLLEARDGDGNATTYRYTRTECGCSERDLVTGIHTPDLPAGVEWTFDYGPDGRVTTVTDPQGFTESFGYRTTGEIASVTDRRSRTTSFEYDQLGRLVSMLDTDSRKQARSYSVPSAGSWTGPTLTALSPDGTAASASLTAPLRDGESQIGLNALPVDGFPARVSLYRDATFALAYRRDFDTSGRLTRRIDRIEKPIDSVVIDSNDRATLTSEQWIYDGRTGLPLLSGFSASRPNGSGQSLGLDRDNELDVTRDVGYGTGLGAFKPTTSFTRDTAGRVIMETQLLGGAGTYGAHFTYRPDGRIATITNVDGASVTVGPTGTTVTEGPHSFTYDARGLIETQPDFDGTYTYSYDEVGRNTVLVYPDGHSRIQVYDELGRLTSRCYHYEDGGIDDRCYGASYDAVGNPVRLTDPEGTDTIEYDALDRVMRVTREEGGATVDVEAYEYNALGALSVNASVAVDHQRPRLDGSGVGAAAVPNTLGGAPVTLDRAGRITSLRSVPFTWDSHDTLIGIGDDSVTLNSAMNRVSKLNASGVGDYYLYAGPNRIGQMKRGGTFPPGDVEYTWLYEGLDHPLRVSVPVRQGPIDGVSTLHPNVAAYYELDITGNVRRLRARLGADLGGYRYTAFGKTIEDTASPNLDQPLRWKGRPREVLGGTEVYDMRARQWVPELGVFLSIDEYEFYDSTTTLWGWPNQNPVRTADPEGRGWLGALVGGLVGARAGVAIGAPIGAAIGGVSTVESGPGVLAGLATGEVVGGAVGATIGFTVGAKAGSDIEDGIRAALTGALEASRKGERGTTAKPTGTNNPDKHLSWDPTRQQWFIRDPHTGKRKYKPKGYRPPPPGIFPLDSDDDDEPNSCE